MTARLTARRITLCSALLSLVAAGTAQAQLVYERTTFLGDPAITSTSMIDFDAYAAGTVLTGQTISGVQLNSPAGGPLTVISAATGVRFPLTTSSSPNVLSPGGSDPSSEDDDLELLFGAPVRAAGLDVVFDVPDGASYVSVSFYDMFGGLLASNGFIPAPSGAPGYQFVGYISSSANIARIVFDEFDPSASDDNVAYDGIVFSPSAGPITATPEPATWGLMATGLVGVAGLARRRRPVAA